MSFKKELLPTLSKQTLAFQSLYTSPCVFRKPSQILAPGKAMKNTLSQNLSQWSNPRWMDDSPMEDSLILDVLKMIGVGP
jgi:hypothetical protein